jgi:catalase
MALEFRLTDGSRQHMTMLNTPVFGAANPGTFNDMIRAGKPDPKLGKPDPEKLHEFLASHPDALAQSSFLANNNPPTSYANSAYSKGPVDWDMVVFVGERGDPDDNPTLAWPETRKHFRAGTLTITKATPQAGAECEKMLRETGLEEVCATRDVARVTEL